MNNINIERDNYMLYQSRQLKQKPSGRSYDPRYSNLNSQRNFQHPNAHYSKGKFARSKTEQASSIKTDSLQNFQDQVNSMLKSISSKRNKSQMKKQKKYFPTIKTGQSQPIHQNQIATDIRSEVSAIKNMLRLQKVEKPIAKSEIQDKLSKIVIQLEHQRQLLKIETQRIVHSRNRSQYTMPPIQQPMQPIIVTPPPQYLYPPPYSSQYHSQHTRKRKSRKMWKESPQTQQSQDDILYEKKKTKEVQNNKKVKKQPFKKKSKYNRIKILFLAVYYFVCLRNQAKKSTVARRKNLEKDCKDNLFAEMTVMKNWLLQSQKMALSILLQKKSLNFSFLKDKSVKVIQEKQNLIMLIVNMGLISLLENCRKQKVKDFGNMIINLCMHRSYPIHNFWTEYEMKQLPISQAFGFLKLDHSLQKFLITLVIFVKVLIYNMLLQPTKFDKVNFNKDQQPLKSNLKLISSVYYLMAKQIATYYLNQPRNSNYYKAGNYRSVKLSKAKCSEPLVYENAVVTNEEFIEGLFDEEDLYDLRVHFKWTVCTKKMREVIEKVHSIVETLKDKKQE